MLDMALKKIPDGVLSASGYNIIKNSLFFIVLLLTGIAVFVPFSPGMPWENLDPSWVYGMNEALAQGMVFGKDIVFTFGPYASIYTKTYHPATDNLMIFGALYLAISFSLVAYLNFRKAGWQSRVALLIALSGIMYSRDALFFFYPLLVGVQIYRWINSFDAKKPNSTATTILFIALFAPFGLLPLIKGSALIACAAITLFSMLLLMRRDQWWLCLLIGAIPVISMLIFWLLSDQPLVGLPSYFIWLLPIISGYSEAMAINGNPSEYVLYTVAVAALVGFMLRETQGPFYDKSLVVLMFICILFLAFKAGFVRHDEHAVMSGTMILMAAILAGTLISSGSSLIIFVVSLAVWICIDSAYIKTSSYSFLENIKKTYLSAWSGIKQRTLHPEKLSNEFDARVIELKARGSIPDLSGTVDIYSYDQSYLIASGNKWSPRPIFQSYSVYTSRLAEKNKAHLLGEHRPDNIIFKVQPIDKRLPSLEDGASWPVLLANYEPTSVSNGYLYLKHRGAGKNSIKSASIFRGDYLLGEQVDLPNSDGLIFVKINLRKSLAGIILNTLFRPSELEIKLVMENGVGRSYRMIAGMAESGFIISPLVENTDEFGLLFAGAKYIADKKVRSIKINAKRLPFLWKESFEIEFYSIGYDSIQLLSIN